ncbi:MAG: Crp/Fnr family transcriptional regulator, partial [Pseudomonadota bacterium]
DNHEQTSLREIALKARSSKAHCFQNLYQLLGAPFLMYQGLPKRLQKFSLEVAPEKTQMMKFSRFHPSMQRRFTFLGFEIYWFYDRKGDPCVMQRTARKKLQGACQRIKEWIRLNRHLKGRDFIIALNRRLQGHYNYYGLKGNSLSLWRFYNWAVECSFKWLNRRGGKRNSFTWGLYGGHLVTDVPTVRGHQITKLGTIMKKSHIQSFREFIEPYSSLDLDEFNILLKLFQLRKYKRKSHIVDPAEYNNSTFFIISGMVRLYYLTNDGKEWNRAFLSENMMSTSFSKDIGQVDPYGIQTLEDTEILFADFSDFQSLFDNNPMIERLHRKLVEKILITKMNRERSFLQSSTKMRYIDFSEQFPDVFQRITQYHLASYLGVTEASLSRLIGESD